MVVGFTGQRAGVYFEAGLMLRLGLAVIWMCKKHELKQVHFDTRQYNFIDYEDISGAKKWLYDRIIAIEGEGPGLRSTNCRGAERIARANAFFAVGCLFPGPQISGGGRGTGQDGRIEPPATS